MKPAYEWDFPWDITDAYEMAKLFNDTPGMEELATDGRWDRSERAILGEWMEALGRYAVVNGRAYRAGYPRKDNARFELHRWVR